MFQRALVYLLNRMHAYHVARIVCRAKKREIDLLTSRIEKCELDKEAVRYSEPVMFAYDPGYRSLEEMRENYFRKRDCAQEEYSKMLRIMDGIKQKDIRKTLTS